MPSKSEIKLAKLLDQCDVLYEQEFSYPDLKSINGNPLRFDFALFETPEDLELKKPKALIELNGEQHYQRKFQTAEQFSRQQSNDKKKVNYCRAKGITLVSIPYTEFDSFTADSVLAAAHYFD